MNRVVILYFCSLAHNILNRIFYQIESQINKLYFKSHKIVCNCIHTFAAIINYEAIKKRHKGERGGDWGEKGGMGIKAIAETIQETVWPRKIIKTQESAISIH